MSDLTPQQRIANVLASRGREVTPDEVSKWMTEIIQKWNGKNESKLDAALLARMIEMEHKTLTMCLHLRFGDSMS